MTLGPYKGSKVISVAGDWSSSFTPTQPQAAPGGGDFKSTERDLALPRLAGGVGRESTVYAPRTKSATRFTSAVAVRAAACS